MCFNLRNVTARGADNEQARAELRVAAAESSSAAATSTMDARKRGFKQMAKEAPRRCPRSGAGVSRSQTRWRSCSPTSSGGAFHRRRRSRLVSRRSLHCADARCFGHDSARPFAAPVGWRVATGSVRTRSDACVGGCRGSPRAGFACRSIGRWHATIYTSLRFALSCNGVPSQARLRLSLHRPMACCRRQRLHARGRVRWLHLD